MHQIKATDIPSLRAVFKERGTTVEDAFLARLSAAQLERYRNLTASAWVPATEFQPLYEAAARALFPGSMDPGYQLGRLMAERSYRGVYRMVLAIPSVSFVIGRAAAVWSAYHSEGEARAEQTGPTTVVLAVTRAPGLPRWYVNVIRGHLAVLAELSGGKGARVSADDDDPQRWRWIVSWG